MFHILRLGFILFATLIAGQVVAPVQSYALVSAVEEEDGSPSTFPWKLKFSNGTVTDNGDGTVSITNTGGGGGTVDDDVTVNSTTVDTTANFLDGEIDFALADGGGGGPDDITATLDATSISARSDTTIADADFVLFWDATDSALKKVDAAELTAGGAETNDLESVATSAGDAEVFVGTGADAGAYITGLAACAADEKIEYVPGSPDTFTCEAIGSLVDADISNTLTASILNITDNEATAETNAVIFSSGGDLDGGEIGLESDGTFNYTPSTGTVASTTFSGALSGNATTATALAADPADCAANEFADAIAANGDLTCNAIVDADVPNTITIDTATVGTTVTVTDNEATAETNAITFVAGADLDGGNVGLESDGDLTYTPNTGTLSATALTEGANAVYNSSETPGGELGGTWASPTVDSGIHDDEYQGLDSELTTIAGLAETNGNVMFVAGGAWTSDATPAIDCTDCTNIPAGTINTADIADVSVTQTELAELETIGATTISANQWTALGGIAETLTSTELNLLDGITTLSGSNTGDNDEVGTKTTGDLCINDGSSVNCTVNTEAELETALDSLDVVTITASDISEANLYTALSDVTEFAETDEGEVITGDWDFSGGGIEIENGTTPPACTEGQLYLDTDATAGQQLLACDGGTFVVQGDGTGTGLGSNLTSSTNDITSDNGTIILQGTGGSNNEVLDLDLETYSNTAYWTTTSGAYFWWGMNAGFNDNNYLAFGDAVDARISYDGTNLIINPDAVGSGVVSIAGELSVTEELLADDLGIEFTAGDTLTDCSTFSATGGGIFYDDSEGIFKKCQDNTLTDLDTTAAGSGDAVTVAGSAVDTTANLVSTGEVAFTLTDGGAGGPDDISANLNEYTKRIFISASGGACMTTAGCADATQSETTTNDVNYFGTAFDGATDEAWQATFTLPENYKDGSTFVASIEWTGTHTAADTVRWDVSMMSIGNDDVLDTAFGTAVSVDDDTTATGDFQRTADTGAITASGSPVGGDRVWVKVNRDANHANDDDTDDATMLGIWVSFTADALDTED